MWPPLLYTWRCYTSGRTVTFKMTVSFLEQLIVEHESMISQLLFTASSLWSCMMNLTICARLRPDLFVALSTVASGNWFS